eukprot:656837-Prymnesium_polylepis.1
MKARERVRKRTLINVQFDSSVKPMMVFSDEKHHYELSQGSDGLWQLQETVHGGSAPPPSVCAQPFRLPLRRADSVLIVSARASS